jgi:hypothetical protein
MKEIVFDYYYYYYYYSQAERQMATKLTKFKDLVSFPF